MSKPLPFVLYKPALCLIQIPRCEFQRHDPLFPPFSLPWQLVSSAVASSFEINILGFDSQFVPARAAIVGTVGPGAPVEYQIGFEPGQDIIARPYTVYLPFVLKNR